MAPRACRRRPRQWTNGPAASPRACRSPWRAYIGACSHWRSTASIGRGRPRPSLLSDCRRTKGPRIETHLFVTGTAVRAVAIWIDVAHENGLSKPSAGCLALSCQSAARSRHRFGARVGRLSREPGNESRVRLLARRDGSTSAVPAALTRGDGYGDVVLAVQAMTPMFTVAESWATRKATSGCP